MDWYFDPLQMFGYDLIMIDCAWEIETYSDKGLGKAPQAHYECMPIEEIKALPVGHLAAPDCLLWCWCTAPMVDQAIEAVAGWGFKYSTMGTWVKTTVNGKLCFGTGWRLRSAAEFFIIATVGRPKTTKATRNAMLAERREHSRKPESAYRACEKLMPSARKVDVFSREQRAGWDNWGKERNLFNGKGEHQAGSIEDRTLHPVGRGRGRVGQTGGAVGGRGRTGANSDQYDLIPVRGEHVMASDHGLD